MDKKYTLTIRMDGKTEQEIREKMDDAHVRSLNAFVLKAIDFYLGYLRQGKNLNFISPILASSIKSEIKNTEHNLSEMVYKMAVQITGKIEDLEMQLDMAKTSGYQLHDNSSNIDLIKKIAQLESELYQTKIQLEEAKN